jgi:hypothetical protein
MFPKLPPVPLTGKQQQALTALLSGRTKTQAAVEANVSYRTLHRWLQDRNFRAHLTLATDATLADATHRLTGVLDEAVTVLTQIMNNPQAKEADRVRAANLLISRSLDLVHQKQILERIATLEGTLLPNQPHPRS